MIQRAIGVLVLFVWSAFALAQGGGAKAGEAVNPLTKAPFQTLSGMWRRVETHHPYLGADLYGHANTCLRWVKIEPSEMQIDFGDLTIEESEGGEAQRYFHSHTGRIWLDESGKIMRGSEDSVVEVVSHDCFRYEFEHYFNERLCRVTSVCDGQTWWQTTEQQDPESGEWERVSYEKYERIQCDDPIAPGSGSPELRLRTIFLPSGTVLNFRLSGEVLEHEYRLGNGLSTKLIVRLSQTEATSFWDFLESVGFREWKALYARPGMMDGVHFRFRYMDGEEVFNVRGDNKAPQRPNAETDDLSLGLISVINSELLRLIIEAKEVYMVPGWTKVETLGW